MELIGGMGGIQLIPCKESPPPPQRERGTVEEGRRFGVEEEEGWGWGGSRRVHRTLSTWERVAPPAPLYPLDFSPVVRFTVGARKSKINPNTSTKPASADSLPSLSPGAP